MYADDFFSHPLPESVRQVVYLEGGEKPDDVVRFAREVGSTYISWGGDEIFWIVFPDNVRRAWDYTERALREDLKRLWCRWPQGR